MLFRSKARKNLLKNYTTPHFIDPWSGNDWGSGLNSNIGIGCLLRFYDLAMSPDGTLFVLRAGADAYCVVEKAGSYSFLPATEETGKKILFQHGIPYKFVRMCTDAEKKVTCSRPSVVKHTIFC